MTDPIADMLTRIRNAISAKHTRVDMPASRLKAEIARILQDEGYIQGFKVLDEANSAKEAGPSRVLRLNLKYGPHGERLITGIERISRPGRRVYFGRDDVPEVLAGLGTSILTTSRGVMTGRAAVKVGVTEGFKRELDIVGVGYRAELKGKQVVFALGYSHAVVFEIPPGIDVAIEKQTHITVTGADRQLVGQVAANIRRLREPDPYKQKGVRYTGEVLKKKAGKTGAK